MWQGVVNRAPENILRHALLTEKGHKENDKPDLEVAQGPPSPILFAPVQGEGPSRPDPVPSSSGTRPLTPQPPVLAVNPLLKKAKGPLRGNPLLAQPYPTKKKRRPGSEFPALEAKADLSSLVEPIFPENQFPPIPDLPFPKSPKMCPIQEFPPDIRIIEIEPELPEQHIDPQGSLPTEGTEYTAHLLSQLSGVLPAMSSSQVSSVLSALEPSSASNHNPSQGTLLKKPDVAEGTNDSASRLLAPAETKVGKVTWWKCSLCPFISLVKSNLSQHTEQAHPDGRLKHSQRVLKENRLTCLGCRNVFYTVQSLRVHLLVDHEIIPSELQLMIDSTVEVNKTWRCLEKPKLLASAVQPEEERPMRGVEDLPKVNLRLAVEPLSQSGDPLGEQIPAKAPSPPQDHSPPATFPSMYQPVVNGKLTQVGKSAAEKAQEEGSKPLKGDNKKDVKVEKDPGIKCPLDGCTIRLVNPENMEYHKQCHDGLVWKCPECERMAATWGNLTLHLWRQHEVDMELYSCDQCPYKTNRLSVLYNLHRRTHGEERPFLCDLCGKGFKTTKQLRNHKSTHKTKDEKSSQRADLVCPICTRSFAETRMLRHHTDNVHYKIRPYVCCMCGHAAATRSSLKMHVRMHTGEKPYSCSECDYATSDHNSLRRHKMRHSGAKHYTCPHCTYACIQSTTFKSHLKSKHPGLDEGIMFSCPYCPFRSIKKEIYLTHTSSHKSEDEGKDGLRQTFIKTVILSSTGEEVKEEVQKMQPRQLQS